MFGNIPSEGDLQPRSRGVVAFADGVMVPLFRDDITLPIHVPASTSSLEIWISLKDEETATTALTYNKIKFSLSPNNFNTSPEEDLQVVGTPITEMGMFGFPVEFYHKITINPSDYGTVGDNVFFRAYVQDITNPVTELPSIGSGLNLKTHAAFKII
jgi:hypothetical protein